MALSHGVAISLDDLDADFDSATVARGVQYAHQGRVRDATWCAPPDRWRAVLISVLDELTVCDANVGAPIGLEFSVTPATTYRPVDAGAACGDRRQTRNVDQERTELAAYSLQLRHG